MSHEIRASEPSFQLTDRIVDDYLSMASQYELLTPEREVELAQAMERGKEAQARLDDVVEYDEETAIILSEAVLKGRESRDEFMLANLRLVVAEAKRYRGRGLEFEDLISEGNIGLARAIDGFDWRLGNRFSTYGGYWIRQALTIAVANGGYNIKIPVDVRRHVNEIRLAMSKADTKSPTQAQLDEAGIEMSLEDATYLLTVADTTSYDVPIGEEGDSSLANHLDELATARDFVESDAVLRHESAMITEALSRISKNHKGAARAAYVVQRRFGTDGEPHQILKEIAEALGISKQGAQYLESVGLRLLRAELSELAIEYGIVDDRKEELRAVS